MKNLSKKTLSLFLTATMVLSLFCVMPAAATEAGTLQDPIVAASVADLTNSRNGTDRNGAAAYAANLDETKSYTLTGSAASTYGLAVVFSDTTATESGYDFIKIYDGSDTLLGTYSGTQLAGKTVYVPQSSTVKIELTADSSNCYYGYAVTSVTALTANDLSLVGSLDTVQSQIATGSALTPAVTVHYGAKTLTAGTDYTVTYTNNTAAGTAAVAVTGTGSYTGTLTGSFTIVNSRTAPADITAAGDIENVTDKTVAFPITVSDSDEMTYWMNAITQVKFGNTTLPVASGDVSWKSVSSWGKTTVYLYLPTSLFYAADNANPSGDTLTGTLTVTATGYADYVKAITVEPEWADDLTVTCYDANLNAISSTTLDADTLTGMETDKQYYHVYCDAAGLGSYAATGVYLTDVLTAAGVTADPSLLSYRFSTGDNWRVNMNGAYLFTDRYYFPSFYDSTTTYAALNNESIAKYLVDGPVTNTAYSAKSAVDGYISRNYSLREVVASTLASAIKVQPMLASSYNYTQVSTSGHLSGMGTNTAVAPVFTTTDNESYTRRLRLMYGMSIVQADDPTTTSTETVAMADNSTTRSLQTYLIYSINVYNPNLATFTDTTTGVKATLDVTGTSLARNITTVNNSSVGDTQKAAGWTLNVAAAASDSAAAKAIAAKAASDGKTLADSGYTYTLGGGTFTDGSFGTLTLQIPTGDADGSVLTAYISDAAGNVTAAPVTVKDGAAEVALTAQDTVAITRVLPESAHDYDKNTNSTQTYTLNTSDASAYGLAVTFSSQTATEAGYDFIKIYDGSDNLLGTYSGTQLAGKTVYVPQSNTVKINLTSDSSGNAYGYAVTSVAALTANDLSLCGTVSVAAARAFTGTAVKPAVTVSYGAKTLTAGTDYTVSYTDNVQPGTATVTVTGAGDYTGVLTRTFTIYNRVLRYTSYTTDSTADTTSSETAEATQTVTVNFTFPEALKITDAAALLQSFSSITLGGSNVSGKTSFSLSADGKTLTVTVSGFFASYSGKLELTSATGYLAGVTTEKTGGVVAFTTFATVRDEHLNVTELRSVTGTASTPASVTVRINHMASVRGMIDALMLTSSSGTAATSILDSASGNFGVGTAVFHAHMFYTMTPATLMTNMAKSCQNAVTKYGNDAYTVTYDADSNTVTLTAKNAVEGQVLDLVIYEDSFLQSEGQALSDPVLAGALPGAYNADTSGWTDPFADVQKDSWYYDEVAFVNQNGLFKGTSDTTFSPDSTLTRAMFVTVLYRMAGQPQVSDATPFTDVSADSYYAAAVAWAYKYGIVSGTGDTTFSPNVSITREQMVKMLYGYYVTYAGNGAGTSDSLAAYTDAGSVSSYAVPAMQWAVGNKIVTGATADTLAPGATATRAQAAALLARLCQAN